MRITRVAAWQVDLPLHEGSYKWSGGKSVAVFDSTVVAVETDAGVTGYGEVCPLGPAYLPAYASGVRAGLLELAPKLVGEDPTQLGKLNRVMDAALKGHPYVKSAVDVACWDILGKIAKLPVCVLLGGRYGEDFHLYRAISQESPEQMAKSVAGYRAEGYRRFQLKVGGDPDTDIARIRAVAAVLKPGDRLVADANTGWLPHEAARVVRAVRDVDVYIEQPCLTYEECLAIRRRTDHPFILDENIDGIDVLVKGHADGAMDVVNLKISKLGGLTKTKQARDLCVSLGIAMTLEDSWGGDIVTAAIAHLAHSTPTEFLFSSTDFNSYVTRSIADGAPQRKNGRLAASTAPGLGVTPKLAEFGKPAVDVRESRPADTGSTAQHFCRHSRLIERPSSSNSFQTSNSHSEYSPPGSILGSRRELSRHLVLHSKTGTLDFPVRVLRRSEPPMPEPLGDLTTTNEFALRAVRVPSLRVYPPSEPQECLNRLIEQWVVLPEEWDELPAPIRADILASRSEDEFFNELTRHQLLTDYQTQRLRRGCGDELILGHYRILDLIGQGGMGTVYRAEHLHLHREVAIKLMSRTVDPNPRLLHRFYGEARSVARLQHPNIVACTDAGRHTAPDLPPRDYYVMELIRGQDLFELVRRGGPLPPNRVCDIFRQIAEALAEAHRVGLVHRDIKPSNIQITPDWQAKLLDFGLALRPQHRMTEPGTVLGTLGYMAPEQARDCQAVDARADLFSLGATMYWALTGDDPFPESGNLLNDLTNRLSASPVNIRRVRPELPEELAAFIARLTDPDPLRRYQSARAVAAALTGFGQWISRMCRTNPAQPARPRVLLIEDDPHLRKLVARLRDCDCSDAEDGEIGWAMLEKTNYDLVVLDVNLPKMSGPEVLARVQANPAIRARTRTLVLSGELTSEGFGGLLLSGADDYLAKPFNSPEFQAHTRALLNRRPDATDWPNARPQHDNSRSVSPPKTHAAMAKPPIPPAIPLTMGVSRLLEEVGLTTRGYFQRIGRYINTLAVAVPDEGEYARLKDPTYLDILARVAAVHDAGMLALPLALLRKPERFSPEDREMIQQHTIIGGDVLRDLIARLPDGLADLSIAEEIVRHHHERWDGVGYPDGLMGAQIPLAARVVTLVSVYEALRSRRPHRPAFNKQQTLRMITVDFAGQFDPTLLAAFKTVASNLDDIFQSSSH